MKNTVNNKIILSSYILSTIILSGLHNAFGVIYVTANVYNIIMTKAPYYFITAVREFIQ